MSDSKQSERVILWLKRTCKTCMRARWAPDIDVDKSSSKTRVRKSNNRNTQMKKWRGSLSNGRRRYIMSMMRISMMSFFPSDTTRQSQRMASAQTLTSIILIQTLGHFVVLLRIPSTTRIGGMREDLAFTCQKMSVIKRKRTRCEWLSSSSLGPHYSHTCDTIFMRRKRQPRIDM